ncbi:uncharacterized protein N7458_003677 [Penicillium daleae]|uniref:Mid2 domain-containing protein n=1 Tax=Penicillium daleae TaxID=63821 RepID=A0AAD6CAV3_9EURO|nr:uncharacterized protein N7458_003677 [Penicillium daleae]KAJ5456094.1 hypothetical protein N7458_003677 [Penicillium daleae]
MVAAVALLVPTVAGTTTAQSTEIDILFPALNEMDMNNLEGSIMSADASSTTIQIDCRSSVTAQCISSGYVLPQTLTKGPSFQDYYYDVTSLFNSTIFVITGRLDCNMTSSTLGASCFASTSTWASRGTNASSSVWSTSVTISSFNLKYNTLTVSSGLENLQTATTAAIIASPSQTVTSTPTPTTTPAVETSSAGHSSSKAWIAGLVIGVLAGLALVAGTAIWCVGRRHKMNTKPLGWEPTNKIPGKSGPRAQNAELKELPAGSQRAELSTQNNRHELL